MGKILAHEEYSYNSYSHPTSETKTKTGGSGFLYDESFVFGLEGGWWWLVESEGTEFNGMCVLKLADWCGDCNDLGRVYNEGFPLALCG